MGGSSRTEAPALSRNGDRMTGSRIAVFDIDGTLTDSVALHQVAFLEAVASFVFPHLDTDWGHLSPSH